MNIRKFWLLTVVVCFSMILVFSVAGCREEVTSKEAAKEEAAGEEKPESEETLELSEQPDKELFNKYFSDIGLSGVCFLGGNIDTEKNISTFLPHYEVFVHAGFKNKKDFTFRTAVFNLEANDFVKKGAVTISSEGADGFSIMDGLLLRPGSYEYRIYVEETLVAVLPFEVISYVDYFRSYFRSAGLDEVKSYATHFFENLGKEK